MDGNHKQGDTINQHVRTNKIDSTTLKQIPNRAFHLVPPHVLRVRHVRSLGSKQHAATLDKIEPEIEMRRKKKIDLRLPMVAPEARKQSQETLEHRIEGLPTSIYIHTHNRRGPNAETQDTRNVDQRPSQLMPGLVGPLRYRMAGSLVQSRSGLNRAVKQSTRDGVHGSPTGPLLRPWDSDVCACVTPHVANHVFQIQLDAFSYVDAVVAWGPFHIDMGTFHGENCSFPDIGSQRFASRDIVVVLTAYTAGYKF